MQLQTGIKKDLFAEFRYKYESIKIMLSPDLGDLLYILFDISDNISDKDSTIPELFTWFKHMKVTLDLNDSGMSFNTLKKEYAIAELAGDSSFFKKYTYACQILSTRSNRFEWSLNVGAEETSTGYRWYYVVPRVQ